MLIVSSQGAQCTYSSYLLAVDSKPANFRTRYRHKITGSKSQAPDDMLGGILADDMGLGKTLTMITTIVATISHAERFAAEGFRNDEETKATMIPVMSTLVIVPSVC